MSSKQQFSRHQLPPQVYFHRRRTAFGLDDDIDTLDIAILYSKYSKILWSQDRQEGEQRVVPTVASPSVPQLIQRTRVNTRITGPNSRGFLQN